MMAMAAHAEPAWRDRANFVIAARVDDERWEQLWARQLTGDRFIVCCVPFFVYDIALGDEVRTAPADGKPYVVCEVTKPSGRYVFRAWFGETVDASNRDRVVRWLVNSGCILEWSSKNLMAIDTQGEELAQEVADFLQGQENRGLLRYETGRR